MGEGGRGGGIRKTIELIKHRGTKLQNYTEKITETRAHARSCRDSDAYLCIQIGRRDLEAPRLVRPYALNVYSNTCVSIVFLNLNSTNQTKRFVWKYLSHRMHARARSLGVRSGMGMAWRIACKQRPFILCTMCVYSTGLWSAIGDDIYATGTVAQSAYNKIHLWSSDLCYYNQYELNYIPMKTILFSGIS